MDKVSGTSLAPPMHGLTYRLNTIGGHAVARRHVERVVPLHIRLQVSYHKLQSVSNLLQPRASTYPSSKTTQRSSRTQIGYLRPVRSPRAVSLLKLNYRHATRPAPDPALTVASQSPKHVNLTSKHHRESSPRSCNFSSLGESRSSLPITESSSLS